MGTLKTFILLAAMTALFMGVGYLIGGVPGMAVAFVVAAAMNIFSYWNSDKIVLTMQGAKEIDPKTASPMLRTFANDVAIMADRAGLPEPEALRKAWADRLDRLSAFARRHNRKVVLAELGYSRSDRAAVRPWDGSEGGEDAEETQRRCLAAALEAIDGHEAIVGTFLWKWFAGPTGRENFLMSTPAMRNVIARHWATNPSAASSPHRGPRPSPDRCGGRSPTRRSVTAAVGRPRPAPGTGRGSR